MYGLTIIDIITIILYFLVVLGMGYYSSLRIKNQEDYFLGGRRFGKLIQTFAAFGQATSVENAVGMTVIVFRNGLAGVLQSISGIFYMPLYWITSIWYRRLRTITLGDFFEERYNSKGIAAFYAVVSATFFMLIIGLGFMAMTKTVTAIAEKPVTELTIEEKAERRQALELDRLENTDTRLLSEADKSRLQELRLLEPREDFSYFNENFLMWLVAIIVILYAGFGGLEAAFLNDTLQGILILALSILLVPFAYTKIEDLFNVEGIGGIVEVARSKLPESAFELWGSPQLTDFTWYYLVVLTITIFINIATQANQLVACGSAKDDYTARFGFTSGILLKRIASLMWGVTAILLIILYSDLISNPDYLWGKATRDLLGSLNLGLVGLMIACLLAALMSTATALMLTASSLLTHNLVRPMFPNKSEKQYLQTGKLNGIVIMIGAVVSAMWFDNIFQMLKILWEFNIIVAACFWLGMKWRRANRKAAWTSAISTALLFFILQIFVPMIPGVRTDTYLAKTIESKEIVSHYEARAVDVENRQKEIELWEKLNEKGIIDTDRPVVLEEGEEFEKKFITKQQSIFWSKGIKYDENGNVYGSGLLSFELLALDAMGFDLSQNDYAMNETLRLLIRSIWPFFILILVALFTRPESKEMLDRFYVKMKTPSVADKKEDERQMKLSYENPGRFDYKKMFPNSNWEFEKFEKIDIKGLLYFSLGGALILSVLYIISFIGK
jgi:solute:Na+ symporter, SSS family